MVDSQDDVPRTTSLANDLAEQVTRRLMDAVASIPTVIPDTREGMLRQIEYCEANPSNLIGMGAVGRLLRKALEL